MSAVLRVARAFDDPCSHIDHEVLVKDGAIAVYCGHSDRFDKVLFTLYHE